MNNNVKKETLSVKNKKNSWLGILIWLLVVVVISLATFFFTSNYIVKWPIIGPSMTPTVLNKDDVLLFKTKKVDYDDVIIFFAPEIHTEGDHLIKRVIGKPGDEISIRYDEEKNCFHVYRNGERLSEDKIYEPMTATSGWHESTVIVPEGKYYVLGDNRNNSTDSSEGIYADADEIKGIVFLRISSTNAISIVR